MAGGRTKCGIDWAYGNPEDGCPTPVPPTSYGPCQEDDFGSAAEVVFDVQSLTVDPNDEWQYFYETVVWFIAGGLDETSAPWHQERYFDRLVAGGTPIENGGSIQEVPTAEHNVPEDPAQDGGADSILAALAEICVE